LKIKDVKVCKSGIINGMWRGVVIYTAGWVVGYVIACVFYLYITKDNEYTMAKYIRHFKALGEVYIVAFFSSLLGFIWGRDDFEKNKMGWVKRASLAVASVGVWFAIWASLFGVSFFPLNVYGDYFLAIFFAVWSLIVLPVFAGLFIMILFAEALGAEYS
jgi:hypothetical protein